MVGFNGARAADFAPKAWPPGTDFLDAETGRQKPALKYVSAGRDPSPATEWPKIPAETPYSAADRKRAVCEDCMVETVGLELKTQHPVVERVSNFPRNGNFRRRDRGSKSSIFRFQTVVETIQSAKKPAFRGDLARAPARVRALETGWWAHQGSNLGPDD